MTSQHSNKEYDVVTLDIPGKEEITVPVYRAGVLLFSPAKELDDWKILVAKPIAKRGGTPPFQLAKGSMKVRPDKDTIEKYGIDKNEIDKDGIDVDKVPENILRFIPKEAFETPAEAGLRELHEEAGAEVKDIKPPRILYDGGPFLFKSVSTGEDKAVHMLAAEAADVTRTYELDPEVTRATAWMSLKEYRKQGREDQVSIIESLLAAVEAKRQITASGPGTRYRTGGRGPTAIG